MFAPEGWLSPSQVVDLIFDEEVKISGCSDDTRARANHRFYLFLKEGAGGAIMMPDGRLVPVNSYFMKRILRLYPFQHRYFNTVTGEVGVTEATASSRAYYFFADLIGRFSRQHAIAMACGALFGGAAVALGRYYFGLDLLLMFVALFFATFFSAYLMVRPAFILRRAARRDCGPYSGGHFVINTGAVDQFLGKLYKVAGSDEAKVNKGGRPNHPAFNWYEERGFDRRVGSSQRLTIKQLQAEMPKDANGNPPAETTIRDWEREYSPRKPPAKTSL